jgi:Fibronectin type III domain
MRGGDSPSPISRNWPVAARAPLPSHGRTGPRRDGPNRPGDRHVRSIVATKAFTFFCSPGFLPILVAEATAGSVVLAWDSNSEPDLAGYRIHYGTVATPYAKLAEVKTTSATSSDLVNGVTYTFVVTTYNTSGNESEYSERISYTMGSSRVIPPAVLANISSRMIGKRPSSPLWHRAPTPL